MRFIPTSVHGPLDYLIGVALIAAPWVGGFVRNGSETWVPVVAGCMVLAQSLLTAYEWGRST